MKMKKMVGKLFCAKGGGLLVALALVVTTLSVNSACMYLLHQPELPASAKKLRKF